MTRGERVVILRRCDGLGDQLGFYIHLLRERQLFDTVDMRISRGLVRFAAQQLESSVTRALGTRSRHYDHVRGPDGGLGKEG